MPTRNVNKVTKPIGIKKNGNKKLAGDLVVEELYKKSKTLDFYEIYLLCVKTLPKAKDKLAVLELMQSAIKDNIDGIEFQEYDETTIDQMKKKHGNPTPFFKKELKSVKEKIAKLKREGAKSDVFKNSTFNTGL